MAVTYLLINLVICICSTSEYHEQSNKASAVPIFSYYMKTMKQKDTVVVQMRYC